MRIYFNLNAIYYRLAIKPISLYFAKILFYINRKLLIKLKVIALIFNVKIKAL